MNNKIIIGSDHAGFKLKGKIIKHLGEKGFSLEDVGCGSDESCDYPVYGKKVAEKVAGGEGRGILICSSGIGMSMVANKVPGVRAALTNSEHVAEMSRKHNDANILVLGERVTDEEVALKMVDVWLSTEFEGGRHQKRIDMF